MRQELHIAAEPMLDSKAPQGQSEKLGWREQQDPRGLSRRFLTPKKKRRVPHPCRSCKGADFDLCADLDTRIHPSNHRLEWQDDAVFIPRWHLRERILSTVPMCPSPPDRRRSDDATNQKVNSHRKPPRNECASPGCSSLCTVPEAPFSDKWGTTPEFAQATNNVGGCRILPRFSEGCDFRHFIESSNSRIQSFVLRTSRGFDPSAGPTIPSFSIRSIRRAARP